MTDPHPEVGGTTFRCTCHGSGVPLQEPPPPVTDLMAEQEDPQPEQDGD